MELEVCDRLDLIDWCDLEVPVDSDAELSPELSLIERKREVFAREPFRLVSMG